MADPPVVVPRCPRCRETGGVSEEQVNHSPLRWFVCRLCSFVWSAARAPE